MFIESVFVTGSNRGLGLEFVKQFLELETPPKYIFAACRNPELAQDLQELKTRADGRTDVHILKLDVTNEAQITQCVETTKKILEDKGLTLLINNAGIMEHTLFPNITAEEYLSHYKVNVMGPMLLAQAFLPLLKESAIRNGDDDKLSPERSAILNVAAKIASFETVNVLIMYNVDAYRITKAAFHLGSAIQARELRNQNILVLTIHPGWVSTDLGGSMAPLTPEQSIKSMMEVLKTADAKQHGLFLNYDGQELNW